ncbi:MAG: GMC family oxidoreductase [Steroidobacteraceae bacterium]|nr:GMC family oxidoreductase [Steroidobacteraceae bacterium]
MIVGAGAAGGVYAERLAARGLRVRILEAGPERGLGDLVSSGLHSRRLKWGGAPVPSSGEHPLSHNVSTGSGTGGAALHHYATWPRFHPDVFRMRSVHGRGLDWGLDYDTLRPWYDRVQREVGVSGDAAREPWRGPGEPYPMPPLRTFAHGDLLAEGFRRVGMPVAPMPIAVNSQPYDGRPACLYDGWCDAGCPIGALGNPLFTYLGRALARGVPLLHEAAVTRVLTDSRGRARGVEYVHRGERREQPAAVVVLAASFIQNPRILFASGESRRPGGGTHPGLANSSGLLGRYLTAEAMGFSYGLFAAETEPWMGVNSGQYYVRAGLRHPGRPDLFGGVQWQVGPAVKPNDIFGLAVTRPDLYGAELHEFLRDASRHFAYMVGFASAEPDVDNRIEPDPSNRDAAGMPLARTLHRHPPATLALWSWMNERGLEVVKAAGATSAWSGAMAAGHVSGGTIMGRDPAASVCDDHGRTHDVPNLFVGGAGLFPQSGGTSPTFTLHAVALRSAEHLAERWRDYRRQ